MTVFIKTLHAKFDLCFKKGEYIRSWALFDSGGVVKQSDYTLLSYLTPRMK